MIEEPTVHYSWFTIRKATTIIKIHQRIRLQFQWKRDSFSIPVPREVASDSFSFLIHSSWLLVFILLVFSLFFSGFNLNCWKGIHFSMNNFLIFPSIFFELIFSFHFWFRDLWRELYKKYEVLLIIFFLLFLLFLLSEGLLFLSFFWRSFHSLSAPSLEICPGEGFYLPDPCELTFANTLLLSNAAISLGNAFISLEISSFYLIFFSFFSFIFPIIFPFLFLYFLSSSLRTSLFLDVFIFPWPGITNLLSPFPSFIEWLCGGHYLYHPTLKRFFLFHFLFPFLLILFLFLHLFYLHFLSSNNPLRNSTNNKIPFFPFIFLKDFFGFILILCLYLLQTHFGISSFSHPDNALDLPFLLFFFQHFLSHLQSRTAFIIFFEFSAGIHVYSLLWTLS